MGAPARIRGYRCSPVPSDPAPDGCPSPMSIEGPPTVPPHTSLRRRPRTPASTVDGTPHPASSHPLGLGGVVPRVLRASIRSRRSVVAQPKHSPLTPVGRNEGSQGYACALRNPCPRFLGRCMHRGSVQRQEQLLWRPSRLDDPGCTPEPGSNRRFHYVAS